MNYEDMSFDELKEECVRRGFLDNDHEYIRKKTKKSLKRQEQLKWFMKKHNISFDEFEAFIDLAGIEEHFKKRLVRELDAF